MKNGKAIAMNINSQVADHTNHCTCTWQSLSRKHEKRQKSDGDKNRYPTSFCCPNVSCFSFNKKKKICQVTYKKREQFEYKKTRSCPFPLMKSPKTTSLHKHSSTCALYVTLVRVYHSSISGLLHAGLVQSDYRPSSFLEPFSPRVSHVWGAYTCGGEWCVRH